MIILRPACRDVDAKSAVKRHWKKIPMPNVQAASPHLFSKWHPPTARLLQLVASSVNTCLSSSNYVHNPSYLTLSKMRCALVPRREIQAQTAHLSAAKHCAKRTSVNHWLGASSAARVSFPFLLVLTHQGFPARRGGIDKGGSSFRMGERRFHWTFQNKRRPLVI